MLATAPEDLGCSPVLVADAALARDRLRVEVAGNVGGGGLIALDGHLEFAVDEPAFDDFAPGGGVAFDGVAALMHDGKNVVAVGVNGEACRCVGVEIQSLQRRRGDPTFDELLEDFQVV